MERRSGAGARPARSARSARSAIGSALVSAVLAAAAAAQGPHYLHAFHGDSPGDFLGSSVGHAGDVNGDGCDDVIAGAQYDDNTGIDAGSARVYSGLEGGVLYTFDGEAAGDRFGAAVAGAGDVDGDGCDDVIVGAPLHDGNGPDAGRARVHSGRTGAVLHVFDGDTPGALFGAAVAGAGDVNGDGFADVIVGAPMGDGSEPAAGMARVFSGLDGAVLHTFLGDNTADRFGAAVSGVGDLDGDGLADLIVGAPKDDNTGNHSGSARLFSGGDGHAIETLNGDQGGDEFGTSVAGAGDVDGDGVPDVLVGAPEAKNAGDDSGIARVFSGVDLRTLYTFEGDSPFDYFGTSVAGAGDVDGDGFADVVVGAPLDDPNGLNSGTVVVLSGRDGSTLHTWAGDDPGDGLGQAVGGGGDVNGLGFADVVAGAPWDDDNGTDTGRVTVFCGLGLATTATFGQGCPATAPLQLGFAGAPRLGQPVDVQLAGVPPGTALLCFDVQNSPPPPLELGFLGAPGCWLYVAADVTVSLPVTAGTAALPIRIPSSPALCGLTFYAQGLAAAPGVNPLGLATSNGGRVVVGF